MQCIQTAIKCQIWSGIRRFLRTSFYMVRIQPLTLGRMLVPPFVCQPRQQNVGMCVLITADSLQDLFTFGHAVSPLPHQTDALGNTIRFAHVLVRKCDVERSRPSCKLNAQPVVLHLNVFYSRTFLQACNNVRPIPEHFTIILLWFSRVDSLVPFYDFIRYPIKSQRCSFIRHVRPIPLHFNITLLWPFSESSTSLLIWS